MAFPPRMVRGGLASSVLASLAVRLCLGCRDHARPQPQIFVLDAFIPIAHLNCSILPLTDQCLALCRPVPPVLRLELQKMPAVLHHPIVADPSFRLDSKHLSQPRRTWRPHVVVLGSRRFPRKSSVVLRKIIRFQIRIRGFVILDPLAPQLLYQAILMYPLLRSTRPFACGEFAAMMRISSRSHMRPNCVVGAFPCCRSLSVGSRL